MTRSLVAMLGSWRSALSKFSKLELFPGCAHERHAEERRRLNLPAERQFHSIGWTGYTSTGKRDSAYIVARCAVARRASYCARPAIVDLNRNDGNLLVGIRELPLGQASAKIDERSKSAPISWVG